MKKKRRPLAETTRGPYGLGMRIMINIEWDDAAGMYKALVRRGTSLKAKEFGNTMREAADNALYAYEESEADMGATDSEFLSDDVGN